jgi:hypothetical protein
MRIYDLDKLASRQRADALFGAAVWALAFFSLLYSVVGGIV